MERKRKKGRRNEAGDGGEPVKSDFPCFLFPLIHSQREREKEREKKRMITAFKLIEKFWCVLDELTSNAISDRTHLLSFSLSSFSPFHVQFLLFSSSPSHSLTQEKSATGSRKSSAVERKKNRKRKKEEKKFNEMAEERERERGKRRKEEENRYIMRVKEEREKRERKKRIGN